MSTCEICVANLYAVVVKGKAMCDSCAKSYYETFGAKPMNRIKPEHTTQDVVLEMSDGNPGAINTMMVMLTQMPALSTGVVLQFLMTLDSWEIYGSGIYLLCNEKCDRDPDKLVTLVRAVILGHAERDQVQRVSRDLTGEEVFDEETWASWQEAIDGGE